MMSGNSALTPRMEQARIVERTPVCASIPCFGVTVACIGMIDSFSHSSQVPEPSLSNKRKAGSSASDLLLVRLCLPDSSPCVLVDSYPCSQPEKSLKPATVVPV